MATRGSVNVGIDKDTYLGSQFDLHFPSVDDITHELTRVGKGALLYKVNVSRAFRYIKIDPCDYDLLGVSWNGIYLDTFSHSVHVIGARFLVPQ